MIGKPVMMVGLSQKIANTAPNADTKQGEDLKKLNMRLIHKLCGKNLDECKCRCNACGRQLPNDEKRLFGSDFKTEVELEIIGKRMQETLAFETRDWCYRNHCRTCFQELNIFGIKNFKPY